MIRIEAVIQPHRLSKVVSALHALPRFPGFTVLDAHGQGHGQGAGGHYAYGDSQGLLYHERRVIVLFCEDNAADEIANAIASAAHTGNSGDGIVVRGTIVSVQRVRDQSGGA
jgi:nitrogen regulatory protein P-II 1